MEQKAQNKKVDRGFLLKYAAKGTRTQYEKEKVELENALARELISGGGELYSNKKHDINPA